MNESQLQRYSRHMMLPEIGEAGQNKLLASNVLVVGAGGLGSPVIFYLAAIGIGRIGIVDNDHVEIGNLQRQIIHNSDRLGQRKVTSATTTINSLNPDIAITPHILRLTKENAPETIQDYDLIADCSDNFATRLVVNDACRVSGKTLVSAAVLRFEGQLATFKPGGPCYRCLYPEDSSDQVLAGVTGPMVGMMGTMQALEIVKEILGIGKSMAGHLLLVDGLTTGFRKIRLPIDPECQHRHC